jgi:hypothetical protein
MANRATGPFEVKIRPQAPTDPAADATLGYDFEYTLG